MKKNLFVGLCAAALLASCAASGPGVKKQQALLRSEWKIVKVNGLPTAGEEIPTMALDAERVYGSTGCNRYFGGYTLSGRQLKFGKLGCTQRLCPDAPSEGAILEALEKVASFKAETDKVFLYDVSGACLMELGK